MKVYFARHGTTNYNDLWLCNADPSADVYITAKGIRQAKVLAEKLKETPIDHIFVSELKRTQQTAEIVNGFHHAPVEVAPLLNDHRSGFEGKNFVLLTEAMDNADNRWTARFNDGESVEDMKKRVATFLNELKTKPYDTVLVVTSKWIIQAAVMIINNISYEEAWALDVQQGDCIELEV
jgi:alpha-ribazole phosphatase